MEIKPQPKKQPLEKLTQDEAGRLYDADGTMLRQPFVALTGKIKPLVVQNPCVDIADVIDEMAGRDSAFIPKGANAYVASDFSGDTQHMRKNGDGTEKMFSVYAVQFYQIFKYSAYPVR